MKQETNGSNRMNKLKEILLKEASALIPFGFVSKKLKDYSDLNGSIRRSIINISSSIALPLYVGSALYFGANPLNPRDYLQKCGEYIEQREIQTIQEVKNDLERQFDNADKNGDGSLSLKEFYGYNLKK